MSRGMKSDHERIHQYAAQVRDRVQATRTAVEQTFARSRELKEEAAAMIRRAEAGLGVIRTARRHLVIDERG